MVENNVIYTLFWTLFIRYVQRNIPAENDSNTVDIYSEGTEINSKADDIR